MNERTLIDQHTRTVPILARALCMSARVLLTTVVLVLPSTVTGLPAACVDEDGDGYGAFGDPSCPNGPEIDCDDTNGDVYPGAPEVCDGVSNDCDHPSWPETFDWVYRFIGLGPTSVFAGDLDGDDDLDVLTARNNYEGSITWYENTPGDGSAWSYHIISPYYYFPYSVFAADLDGDGDLDALAGGEWNNALVWFENLAGDGSTWDLRVLSQTYYVRAIYAVDVDGDGDVDVLSASHDGDTVGNSITWHENTAGNGSSWADHTISNSTDAATSVFALDLDGDNDLDVLSASEGDDKIAWHENTAGDGSAWSEHVISTSADGAQSVFAADVDGDLDPDVLSASRYDDKIAWYENTAGDSSVWSEHVISTSADYATSVFGTDMDGDGDVDILSASYDDDKIAWYENTAGDGSTWTEQEISTSANRAREVIAADLDDNGDPDILVASDFGDDLSWHEQSRFDGDRDGDGMAICEGDCNDTNPHCDVDCTDADKDGYCVTTDCDETNPHCEVDCTDVDQDGYCVTTDCDESDPNNWISCATCADADGDGLFAGCDAYLTIDGPDCDDGNINCTNDCHTDRDIDGIPFCADTCVDHDGDGYGDPGGSGNTCAGPDCNDSNPHCETDCTDVDQDAFCVTTDCDDTDPNNWTSCATCVDADGDTYFFVCDLYNGINGPDCDDTNGAVFPGAPEVCDGVNNDCDHPDWPNALFWVERTVDGWADDLRSVFAADMDGDNDIDALSASLQDDMIAWYENTEGDGSDWTQRAISTSTDHALTAIAADLDGDGDLDVLSGSCYGGAQLVWYANSAGDGSEWTTREIVTQARCALSVFAADLDGDDDLDILTSYDTNSLDGRIAWFENTFGNGLFWLEHDISEPGGGPTTVFAADVDGDDDLDVVAGFTEDDGQTVWYENTTGDGLTWTGQTISTPGAEAVFATDVDGDDDVDVLWVSEVLFYEKVGWHENTVGDGSAWTVHIISDYIDSADSIFAADVDGDGDVDALSASFDDDTVFWYENAAGDGSAWKERVISTSAARARSVFAADVNGNGDMDLLSALSGQGRIKWYDHQRWEGDHDEDGVPVCAGDCEDGHPAVYPGAPETNDGIDNQCPGDEGHGLIDEIEGETGFHDPENRDEYSWPGQPAATSYEAARFAEPDNPVNCTTFTIVDTFVMDPDEPLSGAVFHYLVRSRSPHTGSWGQDSAGVERTDVCP